MTKIKELSQDIGRISEILGVMNRYGFTPKVTPRWWRKKQTDAEAQVFSKAERFTQMLEALGPTFIKIGQLLSTRSDLLPAEFTQALSRLQDKVPPFSFGKVLLEIERSLKSPWKDHFAHIEEEPLASASIAQVHVARLHDGQEVVIKVRRPGIVEQVERDASVIVLLAQVLELTIQEASHYQAVDLAQEFTAALNAELDFRVEARSLKQFAKYNKDRFSIHVPKLYENLCGEALLTMERIIGVRVTDLKNMPQTERENMMQNIVSLGFEHVFVDGLFHADPHPGNILISQDRRIAFIDFGLMGHVSRDMQDRLMAILVALSLKDAETLARLLVQIGEPKGRVSIYAFRQHIRRILDKYLGRSIADVPAGDALADMLSASLHFGIKLPKELALLSKATITLEGIVRIMAPTLDVTALLSSRAENLMADRFDPRNFQSGGKRAALQLLSIAQDIPTQISQMLLDLERGELSIQIKSEALRRIDRSLRGIALSIFAGFFVVAATVVGLCALAWKIPHLAFVSAMLVFFLSSLVCLWGFSGGRLPKISLRKFKNLP